MLEQEADRQFRLQTFFQALTNARILMDAPRADSDRQNEDAIKGIMAAMDNRTYNDLRNLIDEAGRDG
jgi:hypothetical protein